MVALGVFSLFLLTPIAVYPLLSVTRVIEPIDCHSTYKVKIQPFLRGSAAKNISAITVASLSHTLKRTRKD